MYNLLECSKNYTNTVGSFYNYCRDELSGDDIDNNFANTGAVNSNTFKYKNKRIGNTYSLEAADANYDANKEGTQKRIS